MAGCPFRFCVLPVLSVFPVLLSAQGARVSGVVTSDADIPISNITVRDSASGQVSPLDASGRFALAIGTGHRVLIVAGVGLQPRRVELTLESGETREIEVRVAAGIQELPALEVTGEALVPSEYAYTHRYDDFFLRRSLGKGRFFTREEIRAKATTSPIEILRGVPGVRMRIGVPGVPGGNQSRVEFTRCSGYAARVQIWVDGFLMTSGQSIEADSTEVSWRTAEVLEQIPLGDIELMEVYTSQSQLPGDFLRDTCAAIVIWTR